MDIPISIRDRYKIIRQIGAGGMGVVYEAFDSARDFSVALKTHKHKDSNSLYRFKQEFRSLADISHPNLVSLYDLVVESDTSFYTMELLDGVDFVTYCAAKKGTTGYRFDETRLRSAVSQLASGLSALHRARKVHRDIKPSNVLVTKNDRVVIIDFGLVTEPNRVDNKTDTICGSGTPAYMAPEQSSDDTVLTRAADMYSVGVLLYEALTGILPFTGNAFAVSNEKQVTDTKHPKDQCPEVPDDLNRLCAELLSRDANSRPDSEEVVRRSGVISTDLVSQLTIEKEFGDSGVFVGRKQELELLQKSFHKLEQGTFSLSMVIGESGIGKTALIKKFLLDTSSKDASLLVLQGRCYERETVPYKAMDSLIDDLSHTWRNLKYDESIFILPKEADLLCRLFPVLSRVGSVSQAPKRARDFRDASKMRLSGFRALRQTLERLGEIRKLVLFIDDAQWMDVETVDLLMEVSSHPHRPALMLILASRSTSETNSNMEQFIEQCGEATLSINVKPLEKIDVEAMVNAFDEVPAFEVQDHFVRETGGSPFFVEQYLNTFKRDGGAVEMPPLESMLRQNLEQLHERERNLLELFSLAGEPLSSEIAVRASGLEKNEALKTIRALSTTHFLCTAPGQDTEAILPYHDKIRNSVLNSLSVEKKRSRHLALARTIEVLHQSAFDEMALHYAGANEPEKAAVYAIRAAGVADDELSFDKAAGFYKMALDLRQHAPDQERRYREKLGDALSNAGRGAEAAGAYLAATEGAEDKQTWDLRKKAAYRLLFSGRVEEGVKTLGPVLKANSLRMPKTQRWAIAEMVWQRILLKISRPRFRFKERRETEIASEELRQIDLCSTAALSFLATDQMYGVYFQTRFLRLALKAGEPFRIACAFCLEAVGKAMMGGNERAVDKLLDRARQLGQKTGTPYMRAFFAAIDGFVKTFRFDKEGIGLLENAICIFRDSCPGDSPEIYIIESNLLPCLFFDGNLRAMAELARAGEQDARRTGNLFSIINYCSGYPNLIWLVDDDIDLAQKKARSAKLLSPETNVHMQDMLDVIAVAHIALYENKGGEARDNLLLLWNSFSRAGLLRILPGKVALQNLRGRVALATWTEGLRDRRLLKESKRCAKKMDKENSPWATGSSKLIRGQIADIESRRNDAIEEFDRALDIFTSADMKLHVAMAKYGQGKLRGGEEGTRLMAEAHRYLDEQKVVNHEAFLGIFIPWIVHGNQEEKTLVSPHTLRELGVIVKESLES